MELILGKIEDIKGVDAVIFAVAHKEFADLKLRIIKNWYRTDTNQTHNGEVSVASKCDSSKTVLIDVKGIFDIKEAEELNYLYWRL
jgi:UDP-N-acetyl-D-galactosamine dehydrogenase